jgi:hypothetical protein
MTRSVKLLLSAFALVFTSVAATSARSASTQQGKPHTSSRPVMEVYKSPTCGCCTEWVEHVKANGFDAKVIDLDDDALAAKKTTLGIGPKLRSCHTTVVGGYVIEGHVPAEDIARLLKERPAILGLAAPGMPRSSPGMAMPGAPKEPFDVLAVAKNGTTRVFAKH